MSDGSAILVVLIVVLFIIAVIYAVLRDRPRTDHPVPESFAADAVLAEVDIHTSLINDVGFMRNILVQVPIRQERRNLLEAQLYKLETRVKRKSLQLAVIGEFNSGKSTFINALLGMRILKSANIPTTARATEIHFGKRLRLAIQLLTGAEASGTEGDCSAIEAQLSRFLPPLEGPIELMRWIGYVTADPELSKLVDVIRIEAPAPWLSQGICILDTPGVGAGPEYAEHHQEITAQVLEEQADATIVLIPADSPLTRTLLDFLDSTAKPFLSRCIFVITKMDSMEEQDRASIVSHVNMKLTKFLGSSPIVLESGSLAVLREISQPSGEMSPGYWRDEFRKLEQFLRDFLSRQGKAIVAETLVRVANQVINDLNAELAERRHQVERQRQILEANSVQKIDQVLARLRDQSQESMNRVLSQISREIQGATENFATHSKQRIGNLLDNASWGNLKDTINLEIPRALAVEEISFSSTLERSFLSLDRQCAESHQVFAREFENCYRNLKSSGIPQLHNSVGAIPRTRPYTIGFMHATPFSNGPRLKDWVGIAFNKERKRQELRSLLFPAVTSHVQTISAEWYRRLNNAAAAIKSQLDQAVHFHLRQYSATVNAMFREHERAVAALKNEQNTMQAHTLALGQRAKRLDRLRLSLVDSNSTLSGESVRSRAENVFPR